ncbi:hypothetical protein KRZ98_06245 [Sphingobium sp. AS12]|uniref:hypothetical protein n=1 Tax=Sphingobium sp. AS12 TaxID=2849495 RepID=UPI001C3134EF|nr:hypothetical protein [Sphingobium sp. AS12]MBV2147890.1 hypothetical protein [Sphingobium sp. AS12]
MNELLEKTGAAMVAVKAMLDAMAAQPGIDKRSLAVARTQFETGFLWAASAVGGPGILDDAQ